jgi:peptidyl-prolyl cis-trans isomerase D
MLSFFRSGISSKIMLGVLVIGLFAIVVTGFGTDGTGGLGAGGASSSTLATVGGETITDRRVADQVNRQLARAREQQPDLTINAFLAGGAYEGILSQLISQTALVEFGRSQGLTASRRMVDGQIASVPAFKNLAGEFDPIAFQNALRNERLTEAQVREEFSGSLIQQQMLLPIAGAVTVPDSIAQQYASLLLEQRTGAIGLVPAAAMGRGSDPTPQQVEAFYRANAARYAVPERRVIRYATLGTQQLGNAAKATPAEIQAFYRANQADYGSRESRTLSQVILPDQAAARAFTGKIAGGTSFAAAAQAAGFGPADTLIGQQTKAELTELASAAVAEAAFAAAEGTTTSPVQSPLGWHVVRVDAVNQTPGRPLQAVSAEIQAKIEAQKTEEALNALVVRVEDAIADGSSMEEVAREEGLQLAETPSITVQGAAPGVANWTGAPLPQTALKAAFDMTADDDPEVQSLSPNTGYVMFAVGRVLPSAPPPLAEIRERVRVDFAQNRAMERARAVATSIVAKINAGTAPRQAFAEADVRLPTVQAVQARRLDIAQPEQPVPPPLQLLFSLPQNRAKLLSAPEQGGWFVVFHEKSTPGNSGNAPGLVEAAKGQFRRIFGEEYAAQFARAAEQVVKVEKNEAAIARAKAQLLGSGQ